MEGRIDPPSSLLRMDAQDLEHKCREETLILALRGDTLIGCAFARREPDRMYLGKLAVRADFRGQGLARQMIERAEALARSAGLAYLELETRLELVPIARKRLRVPWRVGTRIQF